MGYSHSILLSHIDLGLDLISSQKNPFKTIGHSGTPEGNATHRLCYTVSPDIAQWVAAIIKCLQPVNEWRFVVVLCDLYSFNLTSN